MGQSSTLCQNKVTGDDIDKSYLRWQPLTHPARDSLQPSTLVGLRWSHLQTGDHKQRSCLTPTHLMPVW